MTIMKTMRLSGQDELVHLPPGEGANIVLPDQNLATSKLVTMDKLVNNKWDQPKPGQRLICTTSSYIAYTIQHAKTKSAMVKIMDKEDFSRKTVIKDMQGEVLQFMFKSGYSADTADDTFVLLSLEESGQLHLGIFDIFVTDKEEITHTKICSTVLCCVPPESPPVLAIQPHEEERLVVAVALNTTIYLLKLENDESPGVSDFTIKGVNSPIVCMYIANDDNTTLATCSRDGTVAFHRLDSDNEEPTEPWKPFETEMSDIYVTWMGFPDDNTNPDTQWDTMLIATRDSISIISLQHWQIFYKINIKLSPDKDVLSNDMRYNIDPKGKFLVVSSQDSFIYILELGLDKTTKSPDRFTRMFCYPIRNQLYDLSIFDVTQEETIQSRYEDNSEQNTVSLIGISASAMYKMKAVFDTGYISNSTTNLNELNTSFTSQRSAEPRASPAVRAPVLLSPSSFCTTAASGSRQTTACSYASVTGRDTLPDPAASGSRYAGRDTLPDPASFSRSEAVPIPAPMSVPYAGVPRASLDLMPTPLPTPDTFTKPTSEDAVSTPSSSVEVLNRKITDSELLVLMTHHLYIEGQNSDEAGVLEAELVGMLELQSLMDDAEFCADFIQYYNNSASKQHVHPTVFNQLIAKYLLINSLHSPGTLREITVNYRTFGRDFCDVFQQLISLLLRGCWCLSLSHFDSITKLIYELYTCDVFTCEMMLVVLEQLVKSYFAIQDDNPALFHDWSELVGKNIHILTSLIKQKDYQNQGFLLQVKNVIEPLKSSGSDVFLAQDESPSTFHTESSLLKLLKKSNQQSEEQQSTERPVSDVPYNSVVSLMCMLDKPNVEKQPSYQHDAMNIIQGVLEQGDYRTDVYSEIAAEIVNNYHSKEWFTDLTNHICRTDGKFLWPLKEHLAGKIRAWVQDHDRDTIGSVQIEGLHSLLNQLEELIYSHSTRDTPENFLTLLAVLKLCYQASIQWPKASRGNTEIFLAKVKKAISEFPNLDRTIVDVATRDILPATQPARASPRIPTPRIPTPRIPTPRIPTPHSDIENTDHGPPYVGYETDSGSNAGPPETHFAAHDIRERDREVNFDALFKTQGNITDLTKANTEFGRALLQLKTFTSKETGARNDTRRRIETALKASSKQDRESDALKQCATTFFDTANKYVHDMLEVWTQKEMIDTIKRTVNDVIDKQDKLKFRVDDATKAAIEKDTTQIIKTVNARVHSALTNSLNTEEALKKEVYETILPSFKAMLDGVFKRFEDVIQEEFSSLTANIEQMTSSGTQTESEILLQLDRVEHTIMGLQQRQQESHLNMVTFSQTIEQTINTSIADMYRRHNVRAEMDR